MGEKHALAPYFGDLSAKNLKFKKSFKNLKAGKVCQYLATMVNLP